MDDPIHRDCAELRRESGRLIYPVLSRRSRGLSVGVNVFPDRKTCNFDCPYCEVFPFKSPRSFDPESLARELRHFFSDEYPRLFAPEPVKDLCLSGNGEPTLSAYFVEALTAVVSARDRHAKDADIVVITNATTLGDLGIATPLGRRVEEDRVRVWAKLDAGTDAMYRRMNRSAVPFARLVAGLKTFALHHPVVVQSMFCAFDGVEPATAELRGYADTVSELIKDGAMFSELHLYTQARPAPEGRTSALPDDAMRIIAGIVADALADSVRDAPMVRVFGRTGELEWSPS